MTQLALFPPAARAEQLALDIESTDFRPSFEVAKPETHQLTSTERPTMPTPTEAPDYLTRLPRWYTAWQERRRGRKATRAAQQRRATDIDRLNVTLTIRDLVTIRYALEDRERIHQGTPVGEAAHITRSKLG